MGSSSVLPKFITGEKRVIPNAIFENAQMEFPKICKKCHKIYYDLKGWFADRNLGVPMHFKSTCLIFFRGCQCTNTLAISIDFGDVFFDLMRSVDGGEKKSDLILNLRKQFLCELVDWEKSANRRLQQTSMVSNVKDINIIQSALKMKSTDLLKPTEDGHIQIYLPFLYQSKLFLADGINQAFQYITDGLSRHDKIPCGLFFVDANNIKEIVQMIDKVKGFDSNFQCITFSKDLQNPEEFGLDPHYHCQYHVNDDDPTYLILNALQAYITLE